MPSVPESAVLLTGRVQRIFEPREGDDNPRRRALIQTNDGAAVLSVTPEVEAALSTPLAPGQWVEWLIRYGIYKNPQGEVFLTRRFVREFSAEDGLLIEAERAARPASLRA